MSYSLTLRRRDFALALHDRIVTSGVATTTSNLIANMILQGFGATFQTTAFLLYGTYEETVSTLSGSGLTLPDRLP